MSHPMQAMIDGAVTEIKKATEEANAIASRIINADNQNVLISEARDNSDDPEVVKFRDFFERAMAAIEAKEKEIDAYIVTQGLVDITPIDVEAETVSYKEKAAMIAAFRGAVEKIPGLPEGSLAELPELKRLPGMRGSKAGAGAGSKRPRVAQITVDGVDVFDEKVDPQTQEKSVVTNFTVLAAYLAKHAGTKVEPKDLQAAAFAEAKTDDFKTLEGKPFTFIFNCGKEGEQKNYSITITPRV